MGIIERGVKSFIHPGAEYERQITDLNNLESEHLEVELKKAVAARLISDGGKYIPLLGTMVLSGIGKIPPEIQCVLLPISMGVAAAGLAAESYYTIRNRAVLDILYYRGVRKPPSVLLNELKGDLKISIHNFINKTNTPPPQE